MTCAGCGRSRTERRFALRDRLFRTTERDFELRRCADCGLEFLDPLPTAEVLAGFYPEGYWVGPAGHRSERGLRGRALEAYRRLVLINHVRFVRAVVDEQRSRGVFTRLLDVGCGDGSILDACAVWPCIGLDGSLAALRGVRARGIEAVRGGVARLPFRGGCASIVSLFHVLEHVSPAGPILDEARRVLAPGGSLIVQVPNADSWQARLLRGRWAGYDAPRHVVSYTERTLRHTLEQHGFVVVRLTHFSLRDGPAFVAASLAPGLYPPARLARAGWPQGAREWLTNLGYLALVLAAVPWTLAESAAGNGAAVMVEAQPRPGR